MMIASRQRLGILAAVGALLVVNASVQAWLGEGHRRIALEAVEAAKEALPAFLVEGKATVAHCSLDPDTWTRPLAPALLHAAASPEHYFDIELLKGAEIPAGRYELLTWCAKNDVDPSKVGLLPYALTETVQKLTVALAEHRRWPGNPHVRAKCLVLAGHLAHYAADLTQPLHTTIHYNGRVGADGKSPRTGIHLKVDALVQKLPPDEPLQVDANDVRAVPDVMTAVLGQLRESHALVDRVYTLEPHLPALDAALPPDGEAADFARERARRAVAFTASLLRTAWEDSAKVEIPEWHERETER